MTRGCIREELPAMNFRNANSPAPAAYAASSRLPTASTDRPISISYTIRHKSQIFRTIYVYCLAAPNKK